MLAYHYTTALELAQATGQVEQAADLGPPARRFLTLAGDRALSLDARAAVSFFERALALIPIGDAGRAAGASRELGWRRARPVGTVMPSMPWTQP